MRVDTPSGEAAVGSDAPREKGKASPETLRTGCIAWVEKEGQPRRAEILSIKETKSGKHFYCNFDNFNKRLDEKGQPERFKIQESAVSTNEKGPSFDEGTKNAPERGEQSVHSEATTPHPWTEFVESQTRKSSSIGPDGDPQTFTSVGASATPAATDELDADEEEVRNYEESGFSREEEIEKLRTSGSMSQNPAEISRVRNISRVQFGKNDLFPWYFSPYPEVFSQDDVIFICEFCLSYYGDEKAFLRHRRKCTLQHPPGYFSKEKESADGYNVACIMTLPQHQRKGYGRLLIQFSYELSKIEGKLGSPEKPLSDLGLLSYRQYWSENILDLLLGYNERDDRVTIEVISKTLAMMTQDVEHTLQAMNMQVYHKSDHKIVIPDKLIKQREKQKQKQKRSLDPARIQWKPPVFTAWSRTWGW
ncbi:MOZ/SAS family protein [Hirsutella rhossiliensis]|uniref:Histone acetyltransferase ESA1 n=1 Tax=Hirsutella rhossiliensis TaxID=111463 RepID=A0A9P8MTY5_9HYPO|nr:MOZ/SAS family domain-containing protein [Hirsutella rhossiliensis]KAH0960374.1 MOZ/SAS family domain-containing protein [Hirsutella rhossiliensis]